MSTPRTFGELPPSQYPGERLGMPERGPGSVARVGRRLAALFFDYGLAGSIALLGAPYLSSTWNLLTLGIFGLLQVGALVTLGGSLGHRLFGLRLVRIDGTPLRSGAATIRTVLLLLVFPALVWDSDQRGFHDTVAGTILMRSA